MMHALLSAVSLLAWTAQSCPTNVVDLGYAKHVPTWTNTTSSGLKVSVYKNIRFANPPTGDLRFRLPDTNLPKQHGIQDGTKQLQDGGCVSTAPWFVPYPGLNGTTWGVEDCLFLDVFVPEGVKPGDKVPVLQYYIGSAYTFGGKDIFNEPIGLFDYMKMKGEQNFIFVAHNYRLGIPGWLYRPGEDMGQNVGLHDSIAAGRWTKRYIERFGGDPDRITAIGQSAGGGILSYMTIMDKKFGNLSHQQALISSPALPPRRNVSSRLTDIFNIVLKASNTTSLKELRGLSLEQLKALNQKVIGEMESTGGGGNLGPGIGFSPTPDGKYFHDAPQAIQSQPRQVQDLRRLIVGNMNKEGEGLSSDADMPRRFPELVKRVFPTASRKTIAKIQSGYTWPKDYPEALAQEYTKDVVFGCTADHVASTYPDKAHRYIMSTPPAHHAQDLFYYFFINNESTPVASEPLARKMQGTLLDFVHGRELPWPAFGSDRVMINITDKYWTQNEPHFLKKRCHNINQAILDPANGV